jgi:hypothetical protein
LVDGDVISKVSDDACSEFDELSDVVNDGLSVDKFVNSVSVWNVALAVSTGSTELALLSIGYIDDVLKSITVRSEEAAIESVEEENTISVLVISDESDIVGVNGDVSGLSSIEESLISFVVILVMSTDTAVPSDDVSVTMYIVLLDADISLSNVEVSTPTTVDDSILLEIEEGSSLFDDEVIFVCIVDSAKLELVDDSEFSVFNDEPVFIVSSKVLVDEDSVSVDCSMLIAVELSSILFDDMSLIIKKTVNKFLKTLFERKNLVLIIRIYPHVIYVRASFYSCVFSSISKDCLVLRAFAFA